MSGSAMEDIPNEMGLAIVKNLAQADIKSVRLVNKKYERLGTSALRFDTIYLSPREKDMEVFDGITQHPIWKGKVRNLAFDQAQFMNLSLQQYIFAFFSQLDQQVNGLARPAPSAVLELYGRLSGPEGLLDGIAQLNVPGLSQTMFQHISKAVPRFLDERVLMDGFRH